MKKGEKSLFVRMGDNFKRTERVNNLNYLQLIFAGVRLMTNSKRNKTFKKQVNETFKF